MIYDIMRTVDLFCGCGGLSLGFINAGFDLIAAFDNWDEVLDTYRQNIHGHDVLKMDLSDCNSAIPSIKRYNPQMIIGGPPCQDYSSAGKRTEGERANLTRCFATIIVNVNPKYFVMENVARAKNSTAYNDARTIFKIEGYGLTEMVLNADLCGVPQDRKRFFCIGVKNGTDGALEPYLKANLASKPMSISDMYSFGIDYYYRHPRSYARRGIFSVDEPSPTIRGVNRPVPKGYPGNKNDACPMNDTIRPLTTVERSLIQTFPADYKWPRTKTVAEQMIGNAVPVKLAEYVANLIMKYILCSEPELDDMKDFQKWLEINYSYNNRSVSDIISRVKRAHSLQTIIDEEQYLDALQSNTEFNRLSSSIRSQIKKSITLYFEYHASLSQRNNTPHSLREYNQGENGITNRLL